MYKLACKLTLCFFCCLCTAKGQRLPKVAVDYSFIKSGSAVQDKNFYLLTLLQQLPQVKLALLQNPALVTLAAEKKQAVLSAIKNCNDTISCYFQSLPFNAGQVQQVRNALTTLYNSKPAIRQMVSKHMRHSGYYQLYDSLPDVQLLQHAWIDAANGINYIIQAYSTNTGLRYPHINSVTYAINSGYYRIVINEMMLQVRQRIQNSQLFFQPDLTVALELLFVNNRDEAGRYEPLATINAKAYQRIKTINWGLYPYSAILSPGEGPENNMPLSPNARYRCMLAAEHFKKLQAPFIIVSGGFVHPFQTPYNEAVEMKKYLVQVLQIPENAVIIEPHARHTTTNFRNANRIVYRNGMPHKKILVSTTKYQANYIAADRFAQANISTLGYLPYKDLHRLNDFDIEYLPTITSLHMDSSDPLDP